MLGKGFVLGQLSYFIEFRDYIEEKIEDNKYILIFNPDNEFGVHIRHEKETTKECWDELYLYLYRDILKYGIQYIMDIRNHHTIKEV